MKTLKLRLDCQQKNAETVARYLNEHPLVNRVLYPGLANSPGCELQRAQARGAGAVLSFTTGSVELSHAVVEYTRLFHTCVSFGSIHSTISLPGSMSHASVPPEIRAIRELPEDLVRISVGIEDEMDLIADLEESFRLATGQAPEDASEAVGRTE